MGTGDIGIPTLTALLNSDKHQVVAVVTQPDRPAGRNLALKAPIPKVLALEKGVPVLQPEKLRKEPEPILALEADLLVVVAYGQILPAAVLQLPKIACLNLHASLLPRHRGASPIQAAIFEGDEETGITVMYMDEGLDTGDILLKEQFSIGVRETAGELHDRLAQLAPLALMKALKLLEQGRAPRIPQDSTLATYAPRLSKEDAHLCWQNTSQVLERQVRAMNPWPGAFCWWEGHQRLRILEAVSRDQQEVRGSPGQVLHVDREGIHIHCSEGSLLLRQVHLEGRKAMSATEFARGYDVRPGVILG